MNIKTKTCWIVLWVFCLIVFPSQWVTGQNNSSRYAENSRLSSGKWIKLKVTENGIYKLTYEDIKKMGIGNPAKVKVYGYGGWMQDEDFSTGTYIDDLPEVSVWINKGDDGVFSSGDYLLFYGRGTIQWKGADHKQNPYATYGAYFLTEGESGPKEMTLQSSVKETDVTFTTFDDFYLHEKDSVTILSSGKELYGESFVGKNSREFSFAVPGLASTAGQAYLSFAACPETQTPVTLSINGTDVFQQLLTKPGDTYEKADLAEGSCNWNVEEGATTINAKIYYNASGQTIANLNYLKIGVTRYLQPYDNYTFFRELNKASAGRKNALYKISNATNKCLVFDVTGNYDARLVETTLSGSELTFGATLPAQNEDIREYALVDLSKSFKTPESLGEVKNQNLHALPQTKMVILAPEVFLNQAEALAELHRTRDGLSVTVVQADLIFNEFSSGIPDATAYRRFMKMFYDRAATEDEKPAYLLLFGDGVFDNRFITSQVSKFNPKYYLLTYQVDQSLDETVSYGTDDYFGFLSDDSGSTIDSKKLDLGIGRFPVSSVEQANDAVAKVQLYMNNTRYGNWKNKVIFTADDTDSTTPGSSFCEHATQADSLARYMERVHPEYIVTRSYMDAFKSVDNNGKKTYPDAKKRFMEALKDGCFLLNYTGHGSTKAWSSEDMLEITDVRQMSFQDLPLWITATCDFGWFDGSATSAGEEAFLNKKSGGIALFTTSRVVTTIENYKLNDQLIRHLFTKENNKHLRLGDVLRRSKNKLTGANRLNYVLLGDPALTLNYPEYHVRLESVDGNPVAEDNVLQFKALDKVTVSGVVVNEEDQVIENFNGNLQLTVFDSKQKIESVVTNTNGGHFTFTDYPSTVYANTHEVKNGAFSFSFKVPLDISYTDEKGKMNFYASSTDLKTEANGSFLNYFLNGTNENPEENTDGPEILAMYLNTPAFKEGDKVNETPYFVAHVRDADGINATGSGLGHDIMISIDNSPSMSYVLNKYYQSISEEEGEVKFSIPALPEGKHTLVFRVWDILNNPSVDSLEFNVVTGLKPRLYDILATPNPAKVNTYFMLEHDRPDSRIEVEVRVYDLNGRSIWTHRESGSSEWMKSYPIEWNLTTDGGNRVAPGIYIYRAVIRTAGSKEATQSKKIVVLGQ